MNGNGTLNAYIDGANEVTPNISYNPDINFRTGDRIWVLYINGNNRNLFAFSKRKDDSTAKKNNYLLSTDNIDADTVDGLHANELQDYNGLTNKPELKPVATSGDYNDLGNKPVIPAIPPSLPANGGNADTVGGIPASGFLKAKYQYKGNLDDFHAMEQIVNFTRDECSNTPPGMAHWGGLINLGNIQNTHQQIVIDGHSHNIYTRLFVDWNKPPWTAWQKSWHSGNQGANSGMNADMVDGKHAAELLNYNNLINKPASLPANGGNANTVGGILPGQIARAKIVTKEEINNPNLEPGIYDLRDGTVLTGYGNYFYVIHMSGFDKYTTQIWLPYQNLHDYKICFRKCDSGVWKPFKECFDSSGGTVNGTLYYTDVSRYWLATATNWGIYWDTNTNLIEFHGAGARKGYISLNNGEARFYGNAIAPRFLAAQGANGYSFINEGSYDTGMFSDADGHLYFKANNRIILNNYASRSAVYTENSGFTGRCIRNITYSTALPSEGSSGDMWVMY